MLLEGFVQGFDRLLQEFDRTIIRGVLSFLGALVVSINREPNMMGP